MPEGMKLSDLKASKVQRVQTLRWKQRLLQMCENQFMSQRHYVANF